MKKEFNYQLEVILVIISSILIIAGTSGIFSYFVNDSNILIPLFLLFIGIFFLLVAQKTYKKDPESLDIPILKITIAFCIIFGLLFLSVFIIESINFESIIPNLDFFLMLFLFFIIIIIYFLYIDEKIENYLQRSKHLGKIDNKM